MEQQQTFLWVAAGPRDYTPEVGAAARELGIALQLCTPDTLAATIRQGRFSIVGLEFPDDAQRGLALLRDVAERLPQAVVFVASSDTEVGTMRAALSAGAADYLTLPLNAVDLSRVLIRASQEAQRKASSRPATGQVITIYGCRGGLGCTTLAVNLAVRLREVAAPAEVALVDLDLQRGDVAAFLNLSPSQSIAALADAREVDEIFLHTAMTRHPSGVSVLAAPDGIEAAESVGHAEAAQAFRLLRSQYQYVVVDTARTITPATVAAFEHADHVFLLSDLSLPGVRAALRAMDALQRLEIPPDTVRLLLTRAVPGGVDLAEAVQTLGREPFLVIPNDQAATAAAMNAGTPLNGKPSALTDTIGTLASRIAGGSSEPPRRRGGFIRRIFTREAGA
jgi:pilus assembly protein CpaE